MKKIKRQISMMMIALVLVNATGLVNTDKGSLVFAEDLESKNIIIDSTDIEEILPSSSVETSSDAATEAEVLSTTGSATTDTSNQDISVIELLNRLLADEIEITEEHKKRIINSIDLYDATSQEFIEFSRLFMYFLSKYYSTEIVSPTENDNGFIYTYNSIIVGDQGFPLYVTYTLDQSKLSAELVNYYNGVGKEVYIDDQLENLDDLLTGNEDEAIDKYLYYVYEPNEVISPEHYRYVRKYLYYLSKFSNMISEPTYISGLIRDRKEQILQSVREGNPQYLTIFSSLDRNKLTGDILELYDHVKYYSKDGGIIGYYYTQSDENMGNITSYERVHELIGVKYQESDLRFRISDTFSNIYNNENIKRGVWKGRIRVPRGDNQSFSIYIDRGELNPRGKLRTTDKYNADITLLPLENPQNHTFFGDNFIKKTFDSSDPTIYKWEFKDFTRNSVKAQKYQTLKDSEFFDIIISIQSTVDGGKLPNDIEIRWQLGEDEQEVVIPQENLLYTEDDDNQLSLSEVNSIAFSNLNPLGDYDEDGIPNSWEVEGYYYKNGLLKKYEPTIDKEDNVTIADVYYTSPLLKSSDGDAYSDLKEATSTNMPEVVTAPGNKPTVAAIPVIQAEITGVAVNLSGIEAGSQTVTEVALSSQTTTNKYVNSSSSKNSTSHNFQFGVHGNFELGVKTGVTNSFYKKFEGSTSVKYGYQTDKSNDVSNTTFSSVSFADSSEKETTKRLLLTKNTLKSATVTYKVKFRNLGNDPVYNLQPIVNISIDGKSIKTFKTSATSTSLTVLPGKTSSEIAFETEAASDTREEFIVADSKTVERIINGGSIKIDVIDLEEVEEDSVDTTYTLAQRKEKVNAVTATLIRKDSAKGIKSYQVNAKNYTDYYSPINTLDKALLDIHGISDGKGNGYDRTNLTIDGAKITGIFVKSSNPMYKNLYDQVLQENEGLPDGEKKALALDAFYLTPDMEITVETSTSDTTDPIVLIGIIGSNEIRAVISENGSPLQSVVAKIAYHGEEAITTETLTADPNNESLYTLQIPEGKIVDPYRDSFIVATDENNNSTRRKLGFEDIDKIRKSVLVGGGITLLDEPAAISNMEDYSKLKDEYPALVYIVQKFRLDIGSEYDVTTYVKDDDKMQELLTEDGQQYKLVGYVSQGGNQFVSYNQKTYISLQYGRLNNDFAIDTNLYNKKVKGYLIQATEGSGSNNNELTVNGQRIEITGGSNRDMTHTLVFFVKADPDEPERLNVSYRRTGYKGRRYIGVNIIGYLTEEDGSKLTMLDEEIFVKDISTLPTSDRESIDTSRLTEAFVEPTSLVLRVEHNLTGPYKTLRLNGIQLSNGTTDEMSHPAENYIIVPYNGTNLYYESINYTSSNSNYNISIVGYLYGAK